MMPSPETRLSLLAKLHRREDAEAWFEFVSIYQPLIMEFCRRRGMQYADATDVTQEVMTRVSQEIGRYRHGQERATFRGWLHRITRNLVFDRFRRAKRDLLAQAGGEGLSDVVSESDPTPEESAEFQTGFRQHMFALVAEIVRKQVQPQTWEAFWRTEVERIPADEAASNLGMTRGAVYVAKSRVLARMRKEVQLRLSETGMHNFSPTNSLAKPTNRGDA